MVPGPSVGGRYPGVRYQEVSRYTWGRLSPPMVLISSGGHRKTFGWQAGSMYPTGMLSCSMYKLTLNGVATTENPQHTGIFKVNKCLKVYYTNIQVSLVTVGVRS